MRFAASWVLVLMTVAGSSGGGGQGSIPVGSAQLRQHRKTEERQRQRDAVPLSRERAVVRHGVVAGTAAPIRPGGRFGGSRLYGETWRCRKACAHPS
jgi:hypothetical protein